MNFKPIQWHRDPANPILPPVPSSSYDSTRCMNPWAIRFGDELRLYYSGGDNDGHQRICLATATVDRPTEFTRHGVILDLGQPGNFDSKWCVLPLVRKFGDQWHLYYSGRDDSSTGLQSFWGIGLATSEDGLHFERQSTFPIVTGNQTERFPNNKGIAGGGTIIEDTKDDGSTSYRLYYTLAPGTPDPNDIRVDQEKHCAVCHSKDGLRWTDHRVILSPRPDVSSEDAAVAAPWVWRGDNGYRMMYCGIGTRWGYYSMSEAISEDGYTWDRGKGDENLSLRPNPDCEWESQMVEYPSIVDEGDQLRLFYCGSGYGMTGIGTATGAIYV
jgi:predicted GH43/DUF377 family glycosyl hydrolase